MKMKCRNCGYLCDKDDKYCRECGIPEPITKEQKLPLIGKHIDAGIYRITFAPVEDEFDHMDEVKEAIRNSTWGEDREFGKSSVEFVQSTVTRETHPYICDECREFVSEHTEGKCELCEIIKWVKRTDETEKKRD